MPTAQTVSILLVDDHTLFRRGVKSVFQSYKNQGYNIVAEAGNGKEAIRAIETYQPDIVLMDVEMPVLDGIDASNFIKIQYPRIGVIALSYSNDRNTVMKMVNAGVNGYLLKDTCIEELLLAIRTVYTGSCYFTPAVNMHIVSQCKEETNHAKDSKKKQLTNRETEILKLICEGESSREIADSLYVSKRTIDSFRGKIMKKAGVKNVRQLIRYALLNCFTKD